MNTRNMEYGVERLKCSDCKHLIKTHLGIRCRYEYNLLSNPKKVCSRGERWESMDDEVKE